MLLALSACYKEPKPEEIIEIDVNRISQQRMHELVEANNEILSAIYGTSNFQNTSELKQYAQKFYTDKIVNEYLTDTIFQINDEGTLYSPTLKKEKINKGTLNYEIDVHNVGFVNETQTFSVRFFDTNTTHNVQFVAIYDKTAKDWVLTSLVL